MPAWLLPAIISGSSALGGLFGNRDKKSTTTSENTSTFNTQGTSRPVYDSNVLGLRDKLIGNYSNLLDNFSTDTTGEAINALSTINAGANTASNNIANILASRGIRGPAAGFALSMPQIQQQSQSATYLNSLPEKLRERYLALMGQSGQFMSSLPTGTDTTSSGTSKSTGTSTQINSGNQMAGLFSSLAEILAKAKGEGWFGG